MKHGGMSKAMEGAHEHHRTHFGGQFYTAPNKLHHLEALYSKECGFRLVMYNAFVQPIAARRFQAFIRLIPKSGDAFETIRFMSPSADGNVLRTSIGKDVAEASTIELWVKFPEADEPQMFTVRVVPGR